MRMVQWFGLAVVVALSAGCNRESEENEGAEGAEGGGQSVALAPAEGASAAGAAQTVQITEEKPGLFAQATLTPDQARDKALARVPGTITKGELEEEGGKLIYSFDIKVAGKEGITEVHVDARTGEISPLEHETDVETKKEAGK